ncbi:MAG TPA: hypothetical protein VGM94_06605 [Galbitalea sp.]|jgi:hypothetical protein
MTDPIAATCLFAVAALVVMAILVGGTFMAFRSGDRSSAARPTRGSEAAGELDVHDVGTQRPLESPAHRDEATGKGPS